MKPVSHPPKLKDSADVGPLLRNFRDEQVSSQRLANSASAIRHRVAALTAAKTATLATTAIKIGLPLFIATAVISYHVIVPSKSNDKAAPTNRHAPHIRTTPAANVSTLQSIPPQRLSETSLEKNEFAAPRATTHTIRRKNNTVHPNRTHHKNVEPESEHTQTQSLIADPNPPTAEPTPAAAPIESELLPQLHLFKAAQQASSAGNYDEALKLLDQLQQQFPQTILKEDVQLARAEYLVRAGRPKAAAVAISTILTTGKYHDRSGELWRALGDQLRKQGNCTAAQHAYSKALNQPISAKDTQEILRAKKTCP